MTLNSNLVRGLAELFPTQCGERFNQWVNLFISIYLLIEGSGETFTLKITPSVIDKNNWPAFNIYLKLSIQSIGS